MLYANIQRSLQIILKQKGRGREIDSKELMLLIIFYQGSKNHCVHFAAPFETKEGWRTFLLGTECLLREIRNLLP